MVRHIVIRDDLSRKPKVNEWLTADVLTTVEIQSTLAEHGGQQEELLSGACKKPRLALRLLLWSSSQGNQGATFEKRDFFLSNHDLCDPRWRCTFHFFLKRP